MTAKEAINYIYSYSFSRSRPEPRRMLKLLSQLNHPEEKLKFIHIAGTNGKGSTAAMTAEVLKAAGYRTGLFTSPHVECFNERIMVGGEMISDDELALMTETVAEAADGIGDEYSQFDIITAIGLIYFLARKTDIVVLEVGMGGRLDPTNVIGVPEAAVITRIGLDHMAELGGTVQEIAYEKAGIIKPGSDVVLYANDTAAGSVLKAEALSRGARIYEAEDVIPLKADLGGQSFSYHGGTYELSLLGTNQLKNVAVCLKLIEVLKAKGYTISDEALAEGLRSVRWPARFEPVSLDPVLIVDGGHNPQCAEALADNIRVYLPGDKVRFIIGMMKDKDVSGTVDILRPLAAGFITLTPPGARAMSAGELKELIGDNAVAASDARAALSLALSFGEPVVACGSLYLAGEMLKEARPLSGMPGGG